MWTIAYEVVNVYNEKRVDRSTLATPRHGGDENNGAQVKTQLEIKRKTDNPQHQTDKMNKVRVLITQKSERVICQTGAMSFTPMKR